MTWLKRRDNLADLRTKDQAGLVADLVAAEKKLLELEFNLTLKKLKQTDQINKTRKQIARLQTLLREKMAAAFSHQAEPSEGKE